MFAPCSSLRRVWISLLFSESLVFEFIKRLQDPVEIVRGTRSEPIGLEQVGVGDHGRSPLADPALRDQPVIATDRVRYVGDVVAAVVATDEATAFRAAQAIVVDYEPLPALMTIDEALRPGALARSAAAMFSRRNWR